MRACWPLLALLACSRTTLEPVPEEPPPPRDDRVTLEGRLCTSPPGSKRFPLRVLFVVDASESMEVTDPPDPETGETFREQAVRAAWQTLLQTEDGAPRIDADARVGVVRFSAQARSRTPVDLNGDELPDTYFTDDVEQLETATRALRETDRTTNYVNALDEAYFELRTEMLGAEAESLPRSRYVLVFLSDGLPDSANAGRRNNAGGIMESVGRLAELAELFDVGSFELHTVYLSTDQGVLLDQPAQALLEGMAELGGGTYRSVPNGEAVDFLHIDLSALERVFSLQSLVALNTHALQDFAQVPTRRVPRLDEGAYKDVDHDGAPSCGDLLIDSDADGLSDLVERRVGSDPFVGDTDGDGVGDRIEWALRSSGLDPLDPGDTGCLEQEDADGDGLLDCEEVYLGTSSTAADTDQDGLPDRLEARGATSPVQPDDLDDLDWDHTSNGVEVRSGGDPGCDDAAVRSLTAMDAVVRDEGLVGALRCHSFSFADMTLLPTAAPEGEEAGWNRILIYAGETSFDEPGTFAGWRVACLEARYRLNEGPGTDQKTPPSGVVDFEEADFVDLQAFSPDENCQRP